MIALIILYFGGVNFMNYPLLHCGECLKKIDIENNDNKDKSNFFIKQENTRNIYFAPVGNQFNFGKFANGKTPIIIVMGISTSDTARDNFIDKYIDLRKDGLNCSDAICNSAKLNIYNSSNPTLQKVLIKILIKSGIIKMLGCSDSACIDIDFFKGGGDDDNNYNRVINNIYFSQMIICASCTSEDKSSEPKIKDIGPLQKRCIESQLDFIDSFSDNVYLLISLGKINEKFIKNFDKNNVIGRKCKHHVNIAHPTTKGWNMIDFMHNDKETYIKKIEEEMNNNKKIKDKVRYRTSLINCYDKLSEIKCIVNQGKFYYK